MEKIKKRKENPLQPPVQFNQHPKREWLSSYNHQRISNLISTLQANNETKSATELDGHIEYPMLSRNTYIFRSKGKKISVKWFTDRLGKPILVPVVDTAVKYEDQYDGHSITLMIYNTLHIQDMSINLITPMMMRLAGLYIDECPKFLSSDPNKNVHYIYSKEFDIRMSLQLNGIISVISTSLLTHSKIPFCKTTSYDIWWETTLYTSLSTSYLTMGSKSWIKH